MKNKKYWAIQIFFDKYPSTQIDGFGPFSFDFPASWLVQIALQHNLKKSAS